MSFVENLSREYGDFKIEIPRWEILDEGVTVLSGPSGSGKTSIFRILLGLEKCPSLRWTFKGIAMDQLKTPQRRLGVVFQDLALFPHMSGEKNILFAAQARAIPEVKMRSRLQELSETMQMNNFIHRPVAVLSGGERQRVAIARALIGEPRLLFLDEPFSALDEALREDSRQLVKRVLAQENIPAVLITHDSRDVEVLAHKVSLLKNGKIISEKMY